MTKEKREEARVRVGFLAAAASNEELLVLHVACDRAFVRRLEGSIGTGRPDLPCADRTHHATALIALVEGFNALTAADPRTYSPHRQRTAVERAVDALRT